MNTPNSAAVRPATRTARALFLRSASGARRLHRWRALPAFVCAAVLTSPALADSDLPEKISFTPAFEAGEPVSYRVQQMISLTQTPDAEGIDPTTFNSTITLSLVMTPVALDEQVPPAANENNAPADESEDAQADVSVRAFTVSIESLLASTDANDTAASFSFGGLLPPDTDAGKQAAAALQEVTLDLRVGVDDDAADAEGIAIDGLEAVSEALAVAGVEPRAFALTSDAGLARALAPIFTVDGAAPERRPGTGWETERSVELPPLASLSLLSQHTLKLDEDEQPVVTTQTSFTLQVPQDSTPATPRAALSDASADAVLVWDAERSLLASRTANQALAMTWTLGERSLIQEQQTSTKITLVE